MEAYMALKGNPISVRLKLNEKKEMRIQPSILRISGALLAILILVIFIIGWKLGCLDFFHLVLEKVGFSLGGRALSSTLRGFGCSAGLALTVGFALRVLLTGQDWAAHMMLPSGEGTSGASSSAEASVEPPEPAPERQEPQPADPAIPEVEVVPQEGLWEDLEQPLIPMEERAYALYLRRRYCAYGNSLTPADLACLTYEVETQVDLEIELEKFLRHHGYTADSINANRDRIRGLVFYPTGKATPEETLLCDLSEMRKNFPQSHLFRRIEGPSIMVTFL